MSISEKNFSADVVILAGGFGSRLISEIGKEIPKPMALIGGTPLLEHQILLCKNNGFKKILILVHHLSEVIKNYFGNGAQYGVEIDYVLEEKPRGTAGAIYDSLNYLNNKFIVIYGDTFLDVNLRKFYDAKLDTESVLTFCHPNSHPYDSDLLKLNSDNLVLDVFRPSKTGDKKYKNIVNAALYIADKRVFMDYVKKDRPMDISSELFPLLIDHNEVIRGYQSVEYIRDMGTPKRFKSVNRAYEQNIPSLLSSTNLKRCVFIDRDGVINKHKGHINNINDFEILPKVSEAISLLNENGYLAICITNQPVIARGELTFDELEEIHMKMEADLGLGGAYLDDIFYCPHHPDSGFDGEIIELKINCNCRKPKPGLILEAIEKYNIDTSSSWMIGDHNRDIEAGINAGLSTIFIDDCSVGLKRQNALSTITCKDLFSATNYILDNR